MRVEYINDEIVGRVFGNALQLDMEHDYWERQGCMMALLLWDHPQGVPTVRRWLDRAIATQTSDGRLCYGGTTNLNFGAFRVMDVAIMRQFTATASVSAYFTYPLAMLHERTQDSGYLEAAERQMEAVLRGPRTSEGFLLMNGAAPEVWIDEVYPVCGALARLGRVLNRPELVDEAYHQILLAGRRLIDPADKLSRHVWRERPNSFTESTFWSRGNGWLICAAAEVLSEASDHSSAAATREILSTLLESMAALQDRSGFFHDFLDDPATALEASGTVMFSYAAALAIELGVVSDQLVEPAVRALDAVAGIVEPDGSIGRIVLPPGGPGVPLGKMALGQSFFLLSAYYLRHQLKLNGPLSGA
ncbi:glycoside hydrolase family 88 protein [Sphaerisporangium sp. NBC_01403]|uniref:glycoside hydrolase family 88 protein n=1 Tax=Sphaerisporangium sp. NBC_01403 TaxID=2903599 RepID=UPI00324A6DE6